MKKVLVLLLTLSVNLFMYAIEEVSTTPPSMDTVRFDELECGEEITIAPVPMEGHHFVEWSDGIKDSLRTINPHDFAGDDSEEKDRNLTFTAIFAINEYKITMCVQEGCESMGSVSYIIGDGVETAECLKDSTVDWGTHVTFTAVADECYEFMGWSDAEGTIIYNKSNTTIEMDIKESVEIYAVFRKIKYNVIIRTNDAKMGGVIADNAKKEE